MTFTSLYITNIILISMHIHGSKRIQDSKDKNVKACGNCTLNTDYKSGSVELDCRSRSFHSIPACLFLNVTSLLLDYNNISKLTKGAFVHFNRLETLQLSSNKISIIDVGCFSNLSKLRILDLEDNLIKSSAFQMHIMKDLANLEDLRICRNFNYFPLDQDTVQKTLAVFHNLKRLRIEFGSNHFTFGDSLSNLRSLEYLEICVHAIANNDTFLGLSKSNIKYLKMRVERVEAGTLIPFQNLKGLSISGQENIVTILRLLMPFENITMEYLELGNNYGLLEMQELTRDSVQYLGNICVKDLRLDNNLIVYIHHSAIARLRYKYCIQKLDLSSNYLLSGSPLLILTTMSTFSGLEYLNICCQVYSSRKKRETVSAIEYDSLNRLNTEIGREERTKEQTITQSMNTSLDSQIIVSSRVYLYGNGNIKHLDASHLDLDIDFPYITIVNASLLQILDLGMSTFRSCLGNIYGIPNLEKITISGFDCYKLNPTFLHKFPALKQLVAEEAKLYAGFNYDYNGTFFKGLHNLNHVNLASNKLSSLHDYLFQDQEKSLEVLILNKNNLSSIPIGIMKLQNLIHLDVSDNILTSLTLTERNEFEKHIFKTKNFKLYAKGNNFQCTCETIELMKWFVKFKRYVQDFDSMTCLTSNSTLSLITTFVLELESFERNCISKFWLIFSSCALVLLLIILVVSAMAYRNRIALEYFWLRIKWLLKINKPVESNETYDAFIAYSNENAGWVVNHLVEFLENKCNFHVCFYGRDFLPSNSIASEIFEAIQNSRKVIFVITNEFLESEWLIYELEQTRMHMFRKYHDNNVIIILKDDIPVSKLPYIIRTLYSRTVFLEYPVTDNDADMALFWAKLRASLVRRRATITVNSNEQLQNRVV